MNTTQRFNGSVTGGQQAARDIVNIQLGGGGGDDDDRARRRHELLERQALYSKQRDAAQRRCWWNVYVVVLLLIMLAVAGLGLYFVDLKLSTIGHLWPLMMGLVVAMGIDAWLLERYRAKCRSVWRSHNDMIGEINRALAVL